MVNKDFPFVSKTEVTIDEVFGGEFADVIVNVSPPTEADANHTFAVVIEVDGETVFRDKRFIGGEEGIVVTVPVRFNQPAQDRKNVNVCAFLNDIVEGLHLGD